jgi:signal transduction histidine kinase
MQEEEQGKSYMANGQLAGYIAAAHRNALRLQRLTKEILDVARIESNTLKLSKERFDLVEKLDNVINDIMIYPQLTDTSDKTKDNTEIVFKKPDMAELFINADRVRIYEVVSNLLNNAISATKDGKIIVYLQIVRCVKGDLVASNNDSGNVEKHDSKNNSDKMCVVVSVKDNGTGIDPELKDKLFTKFATKSELGLGLGLYISKSIIESHGGKIWAENNADGKGSTFSFSLPLAN